MARKVCPRGKRRVRRGRRIVCASSKRRSRKAAPSRTVFHFKWKGGGYNAVEAKTSAEAVRKAHAEFGSGYRVDTKTLRKSSSFRSPYHVMMG